MINKTEGQKAHEILDWVLNFLKDNEKYDVLPDIEPGQIYNNQEKRAPAKGDSLGNVFSDFENQVLPGITHWNHPGFSAYFNSSATLPSVVAEMISAAINNCWVSVSESL